MLTFNPTVPPYVDVSRVTATTQLHECIYECEYKDFSNVGVRYAGTAERVYPACPETWEMFLIRLDNLKGTLGSGFLASISGMLVQPKALDILWNPLEYHVLDGQPFRTHRPGNISLPSKKWNLHRQRPHGNEQQSLQMLAVFPSVQSVRLRVWTGRTAVSRGMPGTDGYVGVRPNESLGRTGRDCRCLNLRDVPSQATGGPLVNPGVQSVCLQQRTGRAADCCAELTVGGLDGAIH